MKLHRLVLIGVFVMAVLASAGAQAPETLPGSISTATKPPVTDPVPIPDDARRALQALSERDRGLGDAIAILQEKRDGIQAEWARTIARLQAAAPPGMELSPQLTYVPKKSK